MDELTRILASAEGGDPTASARLLPLVYDELRKLAARKLREERPGQTIQATALVHEAYLRIVGDDASMRWDSRGHFFAAAAEAMRRILVDEARRKQAIKRGGLLDRRDFDATQIQSPATGVDVLELDEALDRLARSRRRSRGAGQAALLRRHDHDGSRRGPRHARADRRAGLGLRPIVPAEGDRRRGRMKAPRFLRGFLADPPARIRIGFRGRYSASHPTGLDTP